MISGLASRSFSWVPIGSPVPAAPQPRDLARVWQRFTTGQPSVRGHTTTGTMTTEDDGTSPGSPYSSVSEKEKT